MQLLLLGAGMGIVGGLVPSPLHLIALAQVGLGRWPRALAILILPPLAVDGALLAATLFFYQLIPRGIAHDVAYVGGVTLLGLATYSLLSMRGKSHQELAESSALTYAGVTAASLAELTAPGTWIYWITIAGPILAEGRTYGYPHVVPFFAGGLLGYYGAAVLSVWLLAWGASLHRHFKRYLFLVANVLLLVLGFSYLIRARWGR
ncbi:MAG TPA: hypothetical protein VGZ29_05190 [Terriglobia bacterium]|nr:hypothetical protein [Terriglobia bacterium]